MDARINQLTRWIDYLEAVKTDQHDHYFQPIAEGKWSKAAIIAHIMYWDRFFFEERLPIMLEGGALIGITTEQIEEMNKKAEAYAHSGVSLLEIVDAAIQQRERLVERLQNQDLSRTFTIKEQLHTLESYVKGEYEHDLHHIKQLKGA
ncbi:hypothetical protein J6TS2_40850 [Heyndrickxia sporothermodurans]|nr:hypothetical protein J6TS2_40850 [Heyndrickxia sporothermodurans]